MVLKNVLSKESAALNSFAERKSGIEKEACGGGVVSPELTTESPLSTLVG